jgi:hypothetical protein
MAQLMRSGNDACPLRERNAPKRVENGFQKHFRRVSMAQGNVRRSFFLGAQQVDVVEEGDEENTENADVDMETFEEATPEAPPQPPQDLVVATVLRPATARVVALGGAGAGAEAETSDRVPVPADSDGFMTPILEDGDESFDDEDVKYWKGA